jgi:hypothetical protein
MAAPNVNLIIIVIFGFEMGSKDCRHIKYQELI